MIPNRAPVAGTFLSIQKRSGIVEGTITGAIRLLCVPNADGNATAPKMKRSFLTIIYGDTPAEDSRSPGIGRNDPVQHSGSRGLACPVRTEEAEDLAFLDIERDMVYSDAVTKNFC